MSVAFLNGGCFLIGYGTDPYLLGMEPDSGQWISEGDGEDDGGRALTDGRTGEESSDSAAGPLSDAGANGGTLVDGWWKSIQPDTRCDGLPGQVCAQSCLDTNAPCALVCQVIATCDVTCAPHTTCHSLCSSIGACSQTCAEHASCWFEASTGMLTATCEADSTCDVACPANATCTLDCSPGASCRFACSAISCGMNCDVTPTKCQDGSLVCGRACD